MLLFSGRRLIASRSGARTLWTGVKCKYTFMTLAVYWSVTSGCADGGDGFVDYYAVSLFMFPRRFSRRRTSVYPGQTLSSVNRRQRTPCETDFIKQSPRTAKSFFGEKKTYTIACRKWCLPAVCVPFSLHSTSVLKNYSGRDAAPTFTKVTVATTNVVHDSS